MIFSRVVMESFLFWIDEEVVIPDRYRRNTERGWSGRIGGIGRKGKGKGHLFRPACPAAPALPADAVTSKVELRADLEEPRLRDRQRWSWSR
jgi:hypothetical protein